MGSSFHIAVHPPGHDPVKVLKLKTPLELLTVVGEQLWAASAQSSRLAVFETTGFNHKQVLVIIDSLTRTEGACRKRKEWLEWSISAVWCGGRSNVLWWSRVVGVI